MAQQLSEWNHRHNRSAYSLSLFLLVVSFNKSVMLVVIMIKFLTEDFLSVLENTKEGDGVERTCTE